MDRRYGHKLAPDVAGMLAEMLTELPSMVLIDFDSLPDVEQDALLNHEIRYLLAGAASRRRWNAACDMPTQQIYDNPKDKQ